MENINNQLNNLFGHLKPHFIGKLKTELLLKKATSFEVFDARKSGNLVLFVCIDHSPGYEFLNGIVKDVTVIPQSNYNDNFDTGFDVCKTAFLEVLKQKQDVVGTDACPFQVARTLFQVKLTSRLVSIICGIANISTMEQVSDLPKMVAFFSQMDKQASERQKAEESGEIAPETGDLGLSA